MFLGGTEITSVDILPRPRAKFVLLQTAIFGLIGFVFCSGCD